MRHKKSRKEAKSKDLLDPSLEGSSPERRRNKHLDLNLWLISLIVEVVGCNRTTKEKDRYQR